MPASWVNVTRVDGLWVRYVSYQAHRGVMRVELQPTGGKHRGELRDYPDVPSAVFDRLIILATSPLRFDQHFARHFRGWGFRLVRAAR